MATSELFKLVPTDLLENLEFRHKLWSRAHGDVGFQADMMKACREDILFWLSAFVFLNEPRDRYFSDGRLKPKVMPFIPWPHQIPVILQIRENIGKRTIVVKKSRGEGMSWIGLLMAMHDWLFFDGKKIGLVSSTEDKSDDPGNMDSLLAKVDWELDKLPKWMGGYPDVHFKRGKTNHSFVNWRNGSQINAFAATSDTGRAGRYTWFMPDELAFWKRPKDQEFMDSIRGSTESRLIISTPNGMNGAYYKVCMNPGSALTLVLDWKDNPSKNRGMYKVIGDQPFLLDPIGNPYPDPIPAGWQIPNQKMFGDLRMKGFKIEGTTRSPWYDSQCLEPDATARSVASEIDMDFGGSMHKFFFPEFFKKAEATIRPPSWRGRLDWLNDPLKAVLVEEDGGKDLKLWCPLDKGNPPLHSYAMGIDLSRGEGGAYTSNSVCSIIDLVTMEQVAEWATNTVDPASFADGCVALAYLFRGAYMMWEHNGPGSVFSARMLELRYANVYYRAEKYARTKQLTGVRKVGWVSGPVSKNTVIEQFRRATMLGELTIRSSALLDECSEYIIVPNTTNAEIRHNAAGRSEDDPNQGQQHGDRVIAMCVALEGAKDRPVSSSQLQQAIADKNAGGLRTFGGRTRHIEEQQQEQDDVWDNRSNYDLMGLPGMYADT